jgi:hypothetical protein
MARVFIWGFEDAFYIQKFFCLGFLFIAGCLGAAVAAVSEWLASELREFTGPRRSARVSDPSTSSRTRVGKACERALRASKAAAEWRRDQAADELL